MMSRAFTEACQHGTHPSYRARINIIGHSGAGKTSLTRRLLGQKFQWEEESTDGIETHRIEFDLHGSPLGSIAWSAAELKVQQLVQIFNENVLGRTNVKVDPIYEDILDVTGAEVDPLYQNTQEITSAQVDPSNDMEGEVTEAVSSPVSQAVLEELQSYTRQKEEEEEQVKRKEAIEAMTANEDKTKHRKQEERKEKKEKRGLFKQLKKAVLLKKKEEKQETEISNHQESPSETEVSHHQESQSKGNAEAKGILRLWDFGGQTEFYTTHHMFLDAKAINIIVMDISKPLRKKLSRQPQDSNQVVGMPETPEDFLCYWLRTIQVKAAEKMIQPTVLLVLTHKDQVAVAQQVNYIDSFQEDVKEIIREKGLPQIPDENIFVVDNKQGLGTQFEQLRKCVKHIIDKDDSWGSLRPIRWLKLEADMKQRIDQKVKKPVKYLTCWEVMKLAEVYHMGEEELEACLLFLHSVGDLIWFPDEGLRDIITLDPQWLVDVFKVLITSEQFILRRDMLEDVIQLLRHGIVSFRSLEKFWAGNDVRFLVEVMKKFDLIIPLESKSGECFLVPSMLPPTQVTPQEASSLRSLQTIYATEYRASFEELFPIGTFAKLLAACSKKWSIHKEEDLSYNFACLLLTEAMKLVLYQPHRSTIQVSIWCQLDLLQIHPLAPILGVTTALQSILQTHNIPTSRLCQLVCPNWRPHYALFCTTDALQESLEPDSVYDSIQYIRGECLCPNIPLSSAVPALQANMSTIQFAQSTPDPELEPKEIGKCLSRPCFFHFLSLDLLLNVMAIWDFTENSLPVQFKLCL